MRRAAHAVNPQAAAETTCSRCGGGGMFVDTPIHDGRSTRRDCCGCGRTLSFPRWYDEARGAGGEARVLETQNKPQHKAK